MANHESRGAFVKFNTLLAHVVVMTGLRLPGIEEYQKKRRILFMFLRFVFLFTIFVDCFYYSDQMFSFSLFLRTRNLPMVIIQGSSIFSMVQCINRIFLMGFQTRKTCEIAEYFDKIQNEDMHRNNKRNMMKEAVRVGNIVSIGFFIFGMSQNFYFMNRIVFKAKRNPIRTYIFPTNNTFQLALVTIYQELSFIGHYCSVVGYSWLLLTFLASMTVEVRVLRDRLGQIFEILHTDRHGNVLVKRNVHKKGVIVENTGVTYEPGACDADVDYSNVTFAEKTPDLKAFQLQIAEEMLGKWLERHNNVLKYTRKLSNLYGTSVLLNYIVVIATTTSWMFTTVSGRHPVSLSVYSLMIIVLLYFTCYFGESLLVAESTIYYDAMGKDFHLYPPKMQRSLRLIIQLSQEKPLYIGMRGIYPLCLSVFSDVMRLCYTILSFLAQMDLG